MKIFYFIIKKLEYFIKYRKYKIIYIYYIMNRLVISIGVVAGVVILYLVSMMFQIKFRDDQYGLELVGGKRGDHGRIIYTRIRASTAWVLYQI